MSLYFINRHGMETYGEVKIFLWSFLTSPLHELWWPASHFMTTPQKLLPVSIEQEILYAPEKLRMWQQEDTFILRRGLNYCCLASYYEYDNWATN
jgi:hypothetical protein